MIRSIASISPATNEAPPPSILTDPPPIEYCLFKAEEWSYEQEWRCIRTVAPKQAREATVDYDAIANVVLCSEMESHHIASILTFVDAVNKEGVGNITVSESVPDVSLRKFGHRPTKLHYSEHCLGVGYVRKSSTAT